MWSGKIIWFLKPLCFLIWKMEIVYTQSAQFSVVYGAVINREKLGISSLVLNILKNYIITSYNYKYLSSI